MELFNLVDKCAKAEEGCLFACDNPHNVSEDTKAKAKEVKRKMPVVLAAEPEQKCDSEQSIPEKERPHSASTTHAHPKY